MSADYKVQRLYDEYIKDIVSDSDKWKKFLELTGRLYRYEFDNILMMYAQRPNATLVGDYDSWKKVGRYVKRGSKGIAIFPSKVLKPHMRYVFDISDTAGRNVNLTWNLNDYNLKIMVDELIDEGKIQTYVSNEKNNLQKLLKNYTKINVRSIIREKSEVMISELNQITGGVIKDRDNKTLGPTVEEMLYKSVFYAVGTRCGFNMSSEEQDMNFIINISGEDNIYRFGSLVCDVSCSVLKEFNYRVRHVENERRVTNGRNETDVPQESRWNVVSRREFYVEEALVNKGKGRNIGVDITLEQYLKENERNRYNTLYRLGRLGEKMNEVDEEANNLLETLMRNYLKIHKPKEPSSTMEMWKIREQAKMMAEEVVLKQIVYRFH